ncbi:hypothetical protein Sru01_05160 [Sphaerisporangium rufum]|uniref:Outer membrane channel protein CpnT-like N-terminal domain-containing protein n=1 Tax=Sphaerisporangium rufum TaxID=1381558 RepID=A0A919QWR0_9ACTN|nr:hypothetical protein [Sphaerisporangium rufum]GII75534.1 hypothetical protein Sru01_05160 [Sphaerisporangium rufum]
MGVTVPPGVDAMLDLLGVPWPNIDEDEIRKDAAAWRTVLAEAEPAAAGADTAVRDLSPDYRGDSATALAGMWQETGASGGHLSQATAAARPAPPLLDGTATVVTATKVAVATWAAVTAVRVGQSLLLGGPLGAGAATANMLVARQAITRILREAGEGTGKVIAPAVTRRITHPLRRILDDLRMPGGGPVLQGAGGPRVPLGAGERKGGLFDGLVHARGDNKKPPLNQENRKGHTSQPSASKRDKHQGGDAHGGRRHIPPNPNKRRGGGS